ncbi:MAG: hypothetical protein AB8B51_00820 [Sedimentitalea sp.]
MKIAFYAQHLTERGTAIATYDYARHNHELLGNETLVLYNQDFPENNPEVVEKYKAAFELIPCRGFAEAEQHARHENCDLMYLQKGGKRDGLVSDVVPTMVHSVFAATVRQLHGASYAYVSEWLSDICARKTVPWVPHMISIAETDDTMRGDLGIPDDARVFGCYGGRTSFDIAFVRQQVIPRVLETCPDVYFLFMNIEKFIDHPRVIFRPAVVDLDEKTAFINACDAMLHARQRGETFGLAIGEFSLRDKPVLTFGRSKENAHLAVLGETALVYRTAEDLYTLIAGFDRSAPSAAEPYRRLFAPAPVMQKFHDNLIKPAMLGDPDGARKRLGLRRWDPTLLARPKIKKLLNQL